MNDYFNTLADFVGERLRGDEIYLANFSGEESDFVRVNQGLVRQAGTVTMRSLTIDLVRGRRHASGTVTLSGDRELDGPRLERLIEDLRSRLPHLPEDPHLLFATEPQSSERTALRRLPRSADALDEILSAARGQDLVGIWAAGGIHQGFANSLGQRNWYTSWSFNFDWSLYHAADRAVTANLAGFEWSRATLERRLAQATEELELLRHPARTIAPGRYRVFLAPAAVYDFLQLLGWGGFGLRAHRSKTTPLLRMVEEGAHLHPSLTLLENTRDGIAPDFQEEGFRRPEVVALVDRGAYRDCLVSPRSAAEYGATTNGASTAESPLSLEVAAGDVPTDDVCRRLGTGIYVGNVWYLNYSDRAACRTTGMTRFATFWVEGGRRVAPLEVMRFDETLYRMLGEKLVGLTAERDLIFDPSTYVGRSTVSARVPGALIEDFTLTL